MKLVQEIGSLIADGVWSLYELPTEEPRYILVTSQRTEFYFLSEQGSFMLSPLSGVRLEDLELGAPVMVIGERWVCLGVGTSDALFGLSVDGGSSALPYGHSGHT